MRAVRCARSSSARTISHPVASPRACRTRLRECAPSRVKWNWPPSRSKRAPQAASSRIRSGPSSTSTRAAGAETMPAPALQGVVEVQLGRVVRSHGDGHSALRVAGVALRGLVLGHHQHLAVAGEAQGRAQAGDAGAEHEEVDANEVIGHARSRVIKESILSAHREVDPLARARESVIRFRSASRSPPPSSHPSSPRKACPCRGRVSVCRLLLLALRRVGPVRVGGEEAGARLHERGSRPRSRPIRDETGVNSRVTVPVVRPSSTRRGRRRARPVGSLLAASRRTACACACSARASASTTCARASRRRRRRRKTSPPARPRAAAAPAPRATRQLEAMAAPARGHGGAPCATRRRASRSGPGARAHCRAGCAESDARDGGRRLHGRLRVPCGRSASPSPAVPTSVQIERGSARRRSAASWSPWDGRGSRWCRAPRSGGAHGPRRARPGGSWPGRRSWSRTASARRPRARSSACTTPS